MSVREYRLIVIDDKRVLVVDDKRSIELRGHLLKQALAFDPEIEPSLKIVSAVPALPRAKHVMPQGITRNVTTRDHYPEFIRPELAGAPTKVLKAVANAGQPITWKKLCRVLTDMPVGTVGSALTSLTTLELLSREKAGEHSPFQYVATAAGLDILTRPEQEKLL